MFTRQDDIRHLIVRYFEQQKELYGDDFIMSREQFGLLENSLGLSQPGASKVVSANSGEDSSPDQAKALQSFYQKIKDCQNCSLGKTRNRFVFGIGNPNAEAMLIGEAPGRDEDRIGEPFVGQAGKLLSKMLAAIKFERKEVFIANILKCRPPSNRDPLPTEVDECEPYLHQQIEIVKPSIILGLGRVSAQTLLKTRESLTELRARLHSYHGIPMVVTFHPAALLRNPQWKYPAWDDLRYFRRVYDTLLNGDDPTAVKFEVYSKSG